MRICLVNDYSLTHIGGAVTSLFEQKKALESAGHTVYILQLGTPPRSVAINQTNVIYIKPSFTLPPVFYNLPFLTGSKKNLRKIHDALSDAAIDVIHFQSEFSLAYAVSKIAKQLSVPTVFTIHTFFWEYIGTTALHVVANIIKILFEKTTRQKILTEKLPGNSVEQMLKNITLTLAKQSGAVISPSSHQRDVLEQTSLKTPLYTAPNPYRAPDDAPTPRVVRTDKHVFRIAWIGRCVPEKRLAEFLAAAAIAQAQSNERVLVDVVGDGSLLPELKELFQSDTIVFHGKQPHAKIVEYIDRSDVVALSSYHFDNQPMTIAEGISRFRGILYCDERLTEGLQSAGYKSDDETPESMAKAIVALAESPSIVRTLSENAKKDSSLFSSRTYASTAEKIYTGLLNK
ncbi:MAG TPA: glycosyltransferase [Candidatus Saccharimonadales bacterium]|nr:glycosyltransferase [Candidatus Saccharimonadales bacterium]